MLAQENNPLLISHWRGSFVIVVDILDISQCSCCPTDDLWGHCILSLSVLSVISAYPFNSILDLRDYCIYCVIRCISIQDTFSSSMGKAMISGSMRALSLSANAI